jgi:flagellar assembly protein FliH
MAVVMEKKPLLMASISGLKNLTVEENSGITRGGCLVESELGQVDATIESQLEEIREKILRAAGGTG